MKRQAALCAKAIKQELKKTFPAIQFKVTSQTYSGGNSVNISFFDALPVEEVEKITRKYQEGHFDGMQDMYEYSNTREDIPQAKFVFVSRHISEDKRLKVKEKLAKTYGIQDINNEQEWREKLSQWSDQAVWSELQKMSF